jgi:hypothetical protein
MAVDPRIIASQIIKPIGTAVSPASTPRAQSSGPYSGTLSIDDLKNLDFSRVPATGSYGEGFVGNLWTYLKQAKDYVKQGKLSVSDYLDIADPIVNKAHETAGRILSSGSKQANSVKGFWEGLQNDGFIKNQNGQFVANAPFTAREYANLPENVLPTQGEVNSGRIPLDLLPPVQRFRPEPTAPTTPQINPGPGNPLSPGTPGQPGTSNGSVISIPDPANPGKSINVPVVGDPLANSVPKTIDQSIIEQEAARQAEQSRQAYEAENAIRSGRLTDLAGLLSKQEDQKFSQDSPGIYEDLNSRGLLRSSGLGDALAREKAKLAGDSANTLMQQGLTDRDAQIQGIQDILARTQSFQTSGLERKFTLEDFQKEADLSKSLGANLAPTVKPGNSVLSGVLGGAVAGGGAGAALGPWGAGIGAVLGGTAGAAKGGGK